MPARPKYPTAAAFLPPEKDLSLPVLQSAARVCRGCDLYQRGTQTVFGAGPARARVMIVGEQPGDQEDLAGTPFVGPAGQLLDRAVGEAGLDRGEIYVTNAVKHFKWTPAPRGKRRIHSKPTAAQVRACRPWLEQELRVVRPDVLVLLGATAAQSLLGPGFKVSKQRGKLVRDTPWAPAVVASLHPSAALRAPDAAAREQMYAAIVADLRTVAAALARGKPGRPGTPARGPAGARTARARASRRNNGAEETRTPNP